MRGKWEKKKKEKENIEATNVVWIGNQPYSKTGYVTYTISYEARLSILILNGRMKETTIATIYEVKTNMIWSK